MRDLACAKFDNNAKAVLGGCLGVAVQLLMCSESCLMCGTSYAAKIKGIVHPNYYFNFYYAPSCHSKCV